MNEEMEKTSLMDKYIKIHLGGAAYRVRLMTLLLFAAAAILLIAAILILAFSGSCAKNKAKAAVAEATATATIEATLEPTAVPTDTPEVANTDAPEETPEPSADPNEPPAEFKTLEVGGTNDGETVKKVQQRLVDLHYLPYPEKDAEGNGVVTTTYGSMCAKAITKFQERNDIKQTGKCDQATYEKLMSDKATAYTMKEKDKLDVVKTIQDALIKKGYLKGKSTGYCGTDTVAAVKAFQKANNLTVDGQAGTKTLELLLGY
ncbi:MAG: peptidoglycan-binding protein [Clostridia bacterium]|jgi:peptidoglycan hydrolase-like protein with peptidoglycan-binding domain|nr:peptidoglycan-binding protein [Clostridia bacterium]